VGIRSYKDLKVWQTGMRLCVQVYELSGNLPKNEQFGLISQMRRAVVSVPANIAEGHRRQYDKEFCQFLHISLGSLAEVETYLCLCEQLEYINEARLAPLYTQIEELGKMLHGLIDKVR